MTTQLDSTKVVSEATHQGIASISLVVNRNSDMTPNPDESVIRVVLAEYNADGEEINRQTLVRTVSQLNAGGPAMADLLSKTKTYYQYIEGVLRSFGFLGSGTDSEDL